jgi:hypothetical protein
MTLHHVGSVGTFRSADDRIESARTARGGGLAMETPWDSRLADLAAAAVLEYPRNETLAAAVADLRVG